MMEKLQGQSRAELEGNIQVAHNWITAITGGTYQGHQALHIAALLDFLKRQYDENVKIYEAQKLKHPEWTKKDEKPAEAAK